MVEHDFSVCIIEFLLFFRWSLTRNVLQLDWAVFIKPCFFNFFFPDNLYTPTRSAFQQASKWEALFAKYPFHIERRSIRGFAFARYA